MSNMKVCFLVVFVTSIFTSVPLLADDIKGSKDHPMISRYQGSSIIFYDTKEFDESYVFTSKLEKEVKRGGLNETNHIRLEGRITNIAYQTPKGRSTLEVLRNYQQALSKDGFETLFECSGSECGKIYKWYQYTSGMGLLWAEGNPRYLAGKLVRPEGDVYVKLYIAGYGGGAAKDQGTVYIALTVIELKAMEEGMVVVDADAMTKEITKTGKVALYGIYFDFDKAVVKPESRPTLEQVAELMKSNTALKLVVVGHTDSKGEFDYNMDLSSSRAEAVANALVNEYGISRSRLRSWGVGYVSPIASNRTEEGQAKNRRVELVEE